MRGILSQVSSHPSQPFVCISVLAACGTGVSRGAGEGCVRCFPSKSGGVPGGWGGGLQTLMLQWESPYPPVNSVRSLAPQMTCDVQSYFGLSLGRVRRV